VTGRAHRDPSVQAVGTGLGLISRAPIDLLVVDDALSDELLRSPGTRQLVRDWFQAVLLDSLSPYGKAVFLGTPMHPEDPMQRFAGQPDTAVLRSPVVDAEGTPTWPERWSAERVERRRKDMDEVAWDRRMLVAPILSADIRTAAEPLNSFIERVSQGALAAPRHLARARAARPCPSAPRPPARPAPRAPAAGGRGTGAATAASWGASRKRGRGTSQKSTGLPCSP
jgi:hypothetical protein